MKLATSIALAVSLAGAALLCAVPVQAAPWEKRVALTPAEVVKDGRWEALAEALHLPWSFDKMFGDKNEATNLPTPCSGQMYGGAWGTDGSPSSDVLAGNGWVFWGRIAGTDGNIPGVLAANTPDGVIIHAEKGASGTAFLFVAAKYGGEVVVSDNGKPTEAAVAEADRLATDIATAVADSKVGKRSKLWDSFSAAVAATPTGALAAKAAVTASELAIVAGMPTDKDGHLLKDGKRVIVEAPGSSAGGTAETGTKAKAAPPATGGEAGDGNPATGASGSRRAATGGGGEHGGNGQPPKGFPWWWIVAVACLIASFAIGWVGRDLPIAAILGMVGGGACGIMALGLKPGAPPTSGDNWMFAWMIGGALACFLVASVGRKIRRRLDARPAPPPPEPAAPGGEEEFEI